MSGARLVVAGFSARESKQRWGFESTTEDVGAVIASSIRTGEGGTVGMARVIIISCCTRTRGRARASYVVSSATAPLASFFWSRPAHARNCFPALNAGEHSGEEGTHVLCEHKLLAASPPICMYVSATALIYDPIQCSASPRYALSTPDGGPSEFSPRNYVDPLSAPSPRAVRNSQASRQDRARRPLSFVVVRVQRVPHLLHLFLITKQERIQQIRPQLHPLPFRPSRGPLATVLPVVPRRPAHDPPPRPGTILPSGPIRHMAGSLYRSTMARAWGSESTSSRNAS